MADKVVKFEGVSERLQSARLVDHDHIQVEFAIDDLIQQLIKDRIGPVASCNGCNHCGGVVAVNPVDVAAKKGG